MNAINHPSYANTRCTEQEVSQAIQDSVALGGGKVTLRYSEVAAQMLTEACEWEAESTYSYRGTIDTGAGEQTWRVALTDS